MATMYFLCLEAKKVTKENSRLSKKKLKIYMSG
jgi:hypothetical protein